MQIIRDLPSASEISIPAIRTLVHKRIEELGGDGFDTEAIGYFLVIEAGDTIEAIHAQVGFNILHNRFTGVRYDQPGFTPSFEFIEEFPSCFDMVFVISDSGFGIELLIPKEEGIDPELIAMCRMYAFKAEQPNQATIYVTAQAMTTVKALVGLNECDRDYLNSKPETRLNQKEGYYLSTESMRLAALPVGAEVVCLLSPSSMDTYQRHVSFPAELRGVVFSGAPKLPENYAAILGFWSPLQIIAQYDGAQHCQNLLNEYEVDIGNDVLLSNGIVVCVQGAHALIEGLAPDQYIEIHIPVDAEMLGMDREKFDSAVAYDTSANLPFERIFLKVQDILDSPDPDFIAVAVLHTENHDADFYL